MEKRSVLVTGVSTGIGRSTAALLVKQGFHVFGSVRKKADADAFVLELGSSSVTPLILDVTDASAVVAAADQVAAKLSEGNLAGLVNSAGIAAQGPLIYQPIDDFFRHFDINVLGPFRMVQAFAPLLGVDPSRKGPPGRIVNVSSIAGKLAAPFLGAYAGSKHALEAYSDSLRRELMMFGIDVVVVGPGAVKTPIWEKSQGQDRSAYEATAYRDALGKFEKGMMEEARKGGSPETIARAIHHALTTRRPKARYAVVAHRVRNWSIPLALPKRMVDRVIANRLGLSAARS
ncbi:MAG: SDR family NAD(P)-dependent oxidoreductase [Pseudomonadota bacterium]